MGYVCPKHLKISLIEIKAEMEKIMNKLEVFKVLIVEDCALFRQLLKEKLQFQFPSIEIHEAINGEEALQKIEVSPPNLIFMDIRLPGENGLDLTKQIKVRYPFIIIILLTSYDLPQYREASIRYKADYFISKGSTTTEKIFSLVESVLSTSS